MTSLLLHRIKVMTLSVASALVLQAQVDSNLATATDLLDVYKSGAVKPEIITIFDLSQSMSGVFWHRKYWTDVNYGSHIGGTPGDGERLMFSINTNNNTVSMGKPSGSGTFSGYLVDYKGVTLGSSIPTITTFLKATHARMTLSQTISGKAYTRTVDLPVPWTLHKDPANATLPTTDLPLAWVDGTLDPDLGAGKYIAYDTVYSAYSLSTIVSKISSKYGLCDYTKDYVQWIFFGTDTKNALGNGNNGGATGVYLDNTGIGPGSGGTGHFIIPGSSTNSGNAATFANGLPTGTRLQYLKKAVLLTWFGNRDRVWWAYRLLDTADQSKTTINSTNYTGTWGVRGTTERDLVLFKKSLVSGTSDNSVTDLQKMAPANSTPLTYAMANALAQMAETGSSIFDKDSTSNTNTLKVGEIPPPCRSSWIIVFTDGNANDKIPDSGDIGTAGGTWADEAAIQSDLKPTTYTLLNPGSANFNIWSLAAVAAHGTGTAAQTTGVWAPDQYAPFRVTGRNASPIRKITTMTVGLCLAGTSADTDGGKGPLLKAALYGDPSRGTGFDLTTAVPYGVAGGTQTNFFDATDPSYLVKSLNAIMSRVVSANAGITAPSAPLVGLNLGTRAYLGRFETTNDGQGGNATWKGDLLMAGLGLQSDGTVGLKDKTGAWATEINASNAVASAYNTLFSTNWGDRKIYTVIPDNIPALGSSMPLDLTISKDTLFSDKNSKLTNIVMGTPDTASALALIRFIQGGNPTAQKDTVVPTPKTGFKLNRTDIMGDVVNSSPTAIEYDSSLLGGSLAAEWSANYASGKAYATDARFQVVFVGDNQAQFHAFGVISGMDSSKVLHAKMEELWSFVPPEFLNPTAGPNVAKLSQLQTGDSTQHIYTVDGSPIIYFADKPINGSVGNFKVDSADTVRVIIGLRKGGRSYYSIDVLNPYVPKLAWALNPNASDDPTIKTMGLATSSIGLAEVEIGSPSAIKDVVVLGGGYSDKDLDGRIIGNNTSAKKLGRSLIVLDVLDGTIIKKYDFINNSSLASAFPNMGAITAGGFPFQFLLGSGRAQRVYFGDQSGGVYALGSMKKLTSGAVGWRVDSSNIDEWTASGSPDNDPIPGNPGIRWIYKGATSSVSGVLNAAPITSPPVAFRVPKSIPQFRRPSTATNAPNMVPPVVGVTFGTGDRNDPMDRDSIDPVSATPLRQVMVFDRQDSADLPSPLPNNVDTITGAITDAQLSNQTSTSTVGDTSYLGSSYLGYFLTYGGPNDDPSSSTTPKHKFYPKAYLSPLVINGGLIFSAFTPTTSGSSNSCSGAGITLTYRLCDALVPVFNSGAKATSQDRTAATCSGWVFQWSNLAGDLTAVGSRLILQSGQDPGSKAGDGTGNARIGSYTVPGGTTAFAPRSWRIVR